MTKEEARTIIQQHPDYHYGFHDAADDTPLHYGMSREYRSGWIALHRARRIMKEIEASAALKVTG